MFSSAEFRKVVSSLALVPNTTARCPDQYVGDVVWRGSDRGFGFRGGPPADFAFRERLGWRLLGRIPRRLILVLESPHNEEFRLDPESKVLSAIGPACGQTGTNICRHLDGATRGIASPRLRVDEEYALILMEAVSYQCSLGATSLVDKASKEVRDQVFRSAWDAGAREDFVERLRALWNSDTLVLNCCTIGGDPDQSLRVIVERALEDEAFAADQRARRYHPASLMHWMGGRSW
jgi:hypothetical protein